MIEYYAIIDQGLVHSTWGSYISIKDTFVKYALKYLPDFTKLPIKGQLLSNDYNKGRKIEFLIDLNGFLYIKYNKTPSPYFLVALSMN